MPRTLSKVYVEYGCAGTFWDVGFRPLQLRHAGVDDPDRSSISVEIEPDGTVILNNGYERGSAPYRAENALFDEFSDAIIEALSKEVPSDSAYAAFLQAAADNAEARRDALENLEGSLAETELDD